MDANNPYRAIPVSRRLRPRRRVYAKMRTTVVINKAGRAFRRLGVSFDEATAAFSAFGEAI